MGEEMNDHLSAGFLFAQPSLASGTARLLDWYGQFDAYNRSANVAESDSRAIFSDWAIVGRGIYDAIETSSPARKGASQADQGAKPSQAVQLDLSLSR